VIALFIERRFDRRVTDEEVCAMARRTEVALAGADVAWRESLLALDGKRSLCIFEVADVNASRNALAGESSTAASAWFGPMPDQADASVPNVVIERSFADPESAARFAAADTACIECLEVYRVILVRTFHSDDGRRSVDVYRAPDAESVRLAQRRAGYPVDAVWACRRIAPDGRDGAAD
jgi:hypothetical protein